MAFHLHPQRQSSPPNYPQHCPVGLYVGPMGSRFLEVPPLVDCCRGFAGGTSLGVGQGREQQADLGHGLGQLLHDRLALLRAERVSRSVHIRHAQRQRIWQDAVRPRLEIVQRLRLFWTHQPNTLSTFLTRHTASQSNADQSHVLQDESRSCAAHTCTES